MDRFLRKCLQLLKYGALIIAGSLYIWALIFLLKSDNWVGISALTTMLLAFAAFWSIRENRRIRDEDRKLSFTLRLLDEVRDWAREAVRLGFLYNRAKSESEMIQIINMIEEVAKTTDAANIAAQVFENELIDPVNRALNVLTKYRDETGKFADKEYFDSFYEVLKVVINLKKKIILQ